MKHAVHPNGAPASSADARANAPAPSSARRTGSISSRARRWGSRLGYVLLAFALILLAAWLAIPPIARWQIETRLTEGLGRRTTVESVSFNPFHLRLTLRNAVIAGRNAATPLLAVTELVADLSSASIWHRAPVLDALTIVGPRVSLARDRAGVLDVQDLIDRAAASAGPQRRFSLNNVQISDGTLTFDDGVTGRRQTVASLAVGVPFLSSLPYETEIHVTPHLSGAFNGSHFSLEGNTTPFTEHRETTVDIDVERLALPGYVDYLPAAPRIGIAAAALTTRLKLAFVDGKAGERRLELRGDARVDDLALRRRDDTPLASAKAIAISIDRIDLLSGDTSIAALAVQAPVVDVKRRSDGTLEWTQPLFDRPARSGPATPATTAPALSAAKIDITGGTVSLDDETTGFKSTLNDVSLTATNVSNVPGRHAKARLTFVSSDRVASFSGEADVEPMVPSATGRFALSKFSLALLFPYYKSALAVDVQKGMLDVDSTFALERDGNLRLTGGTATMSDLRVSLRGAREPLWQVARVAATGIDVDLGARNVTIGSVTGESPTLRLVRERDGSLAVTRIVRTSARDDTSWTVLAKKLALDRGSIDFEDRVPEVPVKLAVRGLALTATDVGNAAVGSSHLAIKSRIGERGRFAFVGNLSRSPLRLAGDVDAASLPLTSARAYVEPMVNVVFTDGAVAAKGRIGIDASDPAAIAATWKGDVAVTDFGAVDKPTASDLARWKSLALEGVDLSTRPFRLAVDRVAADDFYARLIVYPDATLNVTRLLSPGRSPEPEPGATLAPPPTAADASARTSLPIAIGRIDLDHGNVNFTDLFVKPNYTANLTDVEGSVSTLSAVGAGDVSIVARLDHVAPVEIQGTIRPFAEQFALDIHGKARDIDLPPLTPYSVKYAGYGITKGKLAFDVHYEVDQRRLKAENHLVLDQLAFGERVESATATKLPVLLAVSLLKDAHGVIDIHLPIGGSLDDPKFSVGGLIVQVIVNLLTKAATAPFALLASAFGHGEELSMLPFAAGSARIDGDPAKRIETLAKALSDRPGLKLQVAGRADPVADRAALQREAVDNSLKRAKMKALAKEGTAPASIDAVEIAPDERDRWLAQAYRDAPIPDRPRNVLGMLKDVPPADMEAMLHAKAVVDDDALRQLANRRAQAVKDAIVQHGVAGERLFIVAPHIGGDDPKANAPAMRVDLALG